MIPIMEADVSLNNGYDFLGLNGTLADIIYPFDNMVLFAWMDNTYVCITTNLEISYVYQHSYEKFKISIYIVLQPMKPHIHTRKPVS